ncbi:hypothetical protein CR513_21795, partial [Mucuna pruriens]
MRCQVDVMNNNFMVFVHHGCKSIDYSTMHDSPRLTKVWKLMVNFEIMDLGSGFFMVKFDNESNHPKVIDEGPR